MHQGCCGEGNRSEQQISTRATHLPLTWDVPRTVSSECRAVRPAQHRTGKVSQSCILIAIIIIIIVVIILFIKCSCVLRLEGVETIRLYELFVVYGVGGVETKRSGDFDDSIAE